MLPARPAEMQAADLIALGVRLGIIFLGAVFVLRISGVVIRRLEHTIRDRSTGEEAPREKRARTIGSVLRGLTRSLVFIIAALMGVRELGLDITPALAAAGGFGVAMGIGAQSLIRDWISGFFFILDDQYGVGDIVRAAGVTGNIERLTLRHTELRDSDGSLHFIPNGEIKIVTNLTKSWAAPLVRVPVSADEDPERVLKTLDEMARVFRADPSTALLLVDGPNVLGIDEISAGQFTVLIQAKTRPEHRHPVARALRLASMRRLRSAGISLIPATRDGVEPAAASSSGSAPAPGIPAAAPTSGDPQ
jgi:small-conductance mechanosensitive channel